MRYGRRFCRQSMIGVNSLDRLNYSSLRCLENTVAMIGDFQSEKCVESSGQREQVSKFLSDKVREVKRTHTYSLDTLMSKTTKNS